MPTLTERPATRSFVFKGDLDDSALDLVESAVALMRGEGLELGHLHLEPTQLEKKDWDSDSWEPHGPIVRFGEPWEDDE